MALSEDDTRDDMVDSSERSKSWFWDGPIDAPGPTESKDGVTSTSDHKATIPHLDDGSLDDGSLTDNEPVEFKRLRASDRRFLKDVDAKAWDLQVRGHIAGLVCGIVLCHLHRTSVQLIGKGLPIKVHHQVMRPHRPHFVNFVLVSSTSYTSMGILGSILGEIVCHDVALQTIEKSL